MEWAMQPVRDLPPHDLRDAWQTQKGQDELNQPALDISFGQQ
jgi:hypothetical protein